MTLHASARFRRLSYTPGVSGTTRTDDPTAAALGPLEARLMKIVWDMGPRVSVRDVGKGVPDLAYTTVMTTLDRLYKKGMLARHKTGRAFVYSARLTSDELHQSVASRLLRRLLTSVGGSPRPVLSGLVDTIESDSDLNELERLVRDRRARLRQEGR